jgi:uncharacterized membrane protein YuzA (DUF378 family)
MDNSTIHKVTYLLLVVGGLNWGLIGLLDYNLVGEIFGIGMVADVVYTAVGLAAVFGAYNIVAMISKKSSKS